MNATPRWLWPLIAALLACAAGLFWLGMRLYGSGIPAMGEL